MTVELPKKFDRFFEGIATFVDVSIDDIVREELENTIRDFYWADFFESRVNVSEL